MRFRLSNSDLLKLIGPPIVFTSLTSCAVFDYVFDVREICDPGQYQIKYVEIATEIVRVKCMNEGQLDVLKQDSTLRIVSVAYIKRAGND